jgi:N-acetylneuraminate synthase
LVDECQVPFIKVASMELNNYMFLDYIARTGVPIILSTGMGEMDEIRKAVKTIENAGNRRLCILHCISIYPPEISTIRLKNILGLQNEFPSYPVGFSDHSIGIEMVIAAVALGATVIEKHFTLDKSKIGMDNQIACEPGEMTQLVQNCHKVFTALGDPVRIVLPAEMQQRAKLRRSVIAARDLKAGAVLTLADFDVKRPGSGFPPEKVSELVGKRTARDIQADCLISESDISI